MKAMIMAGGEGSRLRPLTCECPKPMVPILGRPVMEYAVRLLAKHGVREAGATVCYLREQVEEYFGDGRRFGLRMRYFPEEEPMGTAGGVKRAESFLDTTFCVLSGDGLTACDLSAALAFHRRKRALATIVLRRAPEPTEYGVAITEPDGRIRAFLEKPDWSDVFSDLINTGIYILEPEALRLVPEGCAYDFSRQLFPEMLRRGLPVFGWETREYWCDIGDIGSYLGAHRAVLDGNTGVEAALGEGGVYVERGAQTSDRARLIPPVWIGAGSVIGEEAEVGPYAVVGAGSRIGRGARVRRAVLWQKAQLANGAQASGCVLAEGAELGERACAYEGSVLGSLSLAPEGCALMPGVRVWPRKVLDCGARAESDVVWGSGEGLRFRGGHLTVRDPVQAVRLGQTLGEGSVLIGRSETTGSLCCGEALAAGLLSQGARVYEAGPAPLPALALQGRLLAADRIAFADGGRILLLRGDGAALTRAEQREIEKKLARERIPSGFSEAVRAPRSAGNVRDLYLGDLARREKKERRRSAAVFACPGALLNLAREALERSGWKARSEWEDGKMEAGKEEWAVWLDPAGTRMALGEGPLKPGDEWQALLLAWTAFERGARRYAVSTGPIRAIGELAARYGAETERVHSGEGEEQQALAAIDPELLRLQTDGIYAAICAMDALERAQLTLAAWRERMPAAAMCTMSVPVEARGGALRALTGEFPGASLGDGLHIDTPEARVSIRPSPRQSACVVSCEARDAEIAEEICAFYAKRVRQAAGKGPCGEQ